MRCSPPVYDLYKIKSKRPERTYRLAACPRWLGHPGSDRRQQDPERRPTVRENVQRTWLQTRRVPVQYEYTSYGNRMKYQSFVVPGWHFSCIFHLHANDPNSSRFRGISVTTDGQCHKSGAVPLPSTTFGSVLSRDFENFQNDEFRTRFFYVIVAQIDQICTDPRLIELGILGYIQGRLPKKTRSILREAVDGTPRPDCHYLATTTLRIHSHDVQWLCQWYRTVTCWIKWQWVRAAARGAGFLFSCADRTFRSYTESTSWISVGCRLAIKTQWLLIVAPTVLIASTRIMLELSLKRTRKFGLFNLFWMCHSPKVIIQYIVFARL